MLCMLVDIGLKFYTVPSGSTCVTLRSRSRTWKFCVKVFVFFASLYFLNMLME